jgi:hypothetical protein
LNALATEGFGWTKSGFFDGAFNLSCMPVVAGDFMLIETFDIIGGGGALVRTTFFFAR